MAKENPDYRQASFAAGEWSPLMYGRNDYKKFPMALRKCLNWIVTPQGALINRPGTQFVAVTKDSTKTSRLVPFNFSNDQNIVMEFGEGYIRFYQNGAQIQNPPGLPVEMSTPYIVADLPKLKFAQSGDVVTITHQSYPPQDLKRMNTAGTVWQMVNTDLGGTGAATMPRTLGLIPFGLGGTDTFQWAVTAVYNGVESLPIISNVAVITRSATSGAELLIEPATGTPPEFFRIYGGKNGVFGLIDEMDYRVVPSASSVFYLDSGTLSIDFNTNPPEWPRALPAAPSVRAASTFYNVGDRVTSSSSTWEAVRVGLSAKVGIPGPSGTTAFEDGAAAFLLGHAYVVGDRFYFDGATWEVTSIFGTGAVASYAYTGRPSTGSQTLGTTNGVNISWIGAGGAVKWKYVQAGTAPSEYPAVVTYFEQRRVFANTAKNPTRVVASQVGKFGSFDVATVPLASDALDFSIASQRYEEIRSFAQLRAMVAMTSEKDWTLSGSGGNPLTPATIDAKPNNVRGTSWLDPIISGVVGLYVQALGTQIWELNFDFYTQSYLGIDVTMEATHLFQRHQIVSWSYAPVPFSVVWGVREDGVLLGMTHVREQEVRAWHRHTTQGFFESVCSIPETINGLAESATYVIVKRTINGVTRRCVERFATRQLPVAAVVDDYPVYDTSKGVFLDASITSAGWVIPNLGHLEGGAVYALVDGNVAGPYTVTGGRIDLSVDFPDAMPTTVIVGLAYNSDAESLDLMPPGVEIRSNMKNVYRASFEVADTRGMAVGPDLANLKVWDQRKVSDGFNAVAPFTGLEHLRIVSRYDHGGRLVFRHSDPLPAILLAYGRETNVGGD